MGRTLGIVPNKAHRNDFNSLAPCGANHGNVCRLERHVHFNSLAPCGANLLFNCNIRDLKLFQLTRPVWGEPRRVSEHRINIGFQLTRPVWGEPKRTRIICTISRFQLTRPVWGEPRHTATSRNIRRFQLTRPVWGEPDLLLLAWAKTRISTHSPRVGRTSPSFTCLGRESYFNSLAPCGANRTFASSTRV